MKKIAFVLVAMAAWFAAAPTFAANIEPFSTFCSRQWRRLDFSCPFPDHDILIDGEIIPGDARKFERVVRGIGRRVGTVVLRSQGGSVPDAMAIGRLVRKLMIETEGPGFYSESGGASCEPERGHPNAVCVCASACFLVYAGGFPRDVSYVLLHRPFVNPSINAGMSYDDSMRLASEARKEVAEYLREMGVPDRYANILFSTPSNIAAHVPLNDMQNVFSGYPPEVEEWLMAKCHTITTGQDEQRLADNSAREATKGGYRIEDSLAIKASLMRDICVYEALKSKRAAVRAEWFGPATEAEKMKDEEATRKIQAFEAFLSSINDGTKP